MHELLQAKRSGEFQLWFLCLGLVIWCALLNNQPSLNWKSWLQHPMDVKGLQGDKAEGRLYIGNLDFRISESDIIKMFSPFGKITAEDFLWHTCGPKRGEPRGYAFVQYTTKEEAQLAKEKMNGKLVCGRPMVVHLASEKSSLDSSHSHRALKDKKVTGGSAIRSAQTDRAAKIAAIKNKLKSLEEEGCSTKRPRLTPNGLTGTSKHSHKKF